MKWLISKLPVIALLVLFISSCGIMGSSEGPEEATVNINVDWEAVSPNTQTQQKLAYNTTSDIDSIATHFGVRVIYESHDAVYSQSVENTEGEATSLITLDIPTADSVRINGVAVYKGDTKNAVVNMGVVRESTINQATEYNFTVADFKWTNPSWKLKEEPIQGMENAVQRSAEESSTRVPFLVANPFDLDPGKQYDKLSIKISGSGGPGDVQENNQREYFVQVDNPSPGDSTSSAKDVMPYLDSSMFNLPTERYVVGQRKVVQVIWD